MHRQGQGEGFGGHALQEYRPNCLIQVSPRNALTGSIPLGNASALTQVIWDDTLSSALVIAHRHPLAASAIPHANAPVTDDSRNTLLPTGTLVRVALKNTVSSAHSKSGDKFSFTINISLEGSPTDVVFAGTFDGTTMKGSISVQGLDIVFTGSKPGRTMSGQSTTQQGEAQ